MVQVNGSSTQRDQRLLDVTCCRKSVDPKYFVLATTLSLWIDVYPSIQFDWDNITGRILLLPSAAGYVFIRKIRYNFRPNQAAVPHVVTNNLL